MIIYVHCIHRVTVEENMMPMYETKIHHAPQSARHVLWWRICCYWGMNGPEWYICNEPKLVNVGVIHIQEPYSWLHGWSQLCQNINNWPGNAWQRKLQLVHQYLSHISASDTLGCRSEVCLNFTDIPGKAATLVQICKPMSHILTDVLNIS